MPDHLTGLVQAYREPRSASELARFIELTVLDCLGRTMSGGVSESGGDFSLQLDDPYDGEPDGDVSIVVMSTGEYLGLLEARRELARRGRRQTG